MKGSIVISILVLTATLHQKFFHEGSTQMENELTISNIEALSRSEYDPNIAYQHHLEQCYVDEQVGHQILKKNVGAKCKPFPEGECVRSWQWGSCEK